MMSSSTTSAASVCLAIALALPVFAVPALFGGSEYCQVALSAAETLCSDQRAIQLKRPCIGRAMRDARTQLTDPADIRFRVLTDGKAVAYHFACAGR